MDMQWFGQSCFLLTSAQSTRVLIDPFRRFLGYRMPVVEADLVAVTHDHRDHNQVKAASGDFKLVNGPEPATVKDVSIRGVRTFHDKHQGAKRGSNLVFVIELDGLVVCHCGDLGHLLTQEQAAAIGRVDVLIVPVGGKMTLGGAEAAQTVAQLKPAVAIPMHYRTKATGIVGRLLFEPAAPFVEATGLPAASGVRTLTLDSASLDANRGVVEMAYDSE
ncbi:L-ascorbate metabolism protein UlaG, beta-lactamase superfamily [Paenibacillus sp. UNC496MF]|nr:L-ascorbate metabolism protein UlaG, beta-lactamase superfamily [Paenibacillus sp. UNC496MF]